MYGTRPQIVESCRVIKTHGFSGACLRRVAATINVAVMGLDEQSDRPRVAARTVVRHIRKSIWLQPRRDGSARSKGLPEFVGLFLPQIEAWGPAR